MNLYLYCNSDINTVWSFFLFFISRGVQYGLWGTCGRTDALKSPHFKSSLCRAWCIFSLTLLGAWCCDCVLIAQNAGKYHLKITQWLVKFVDKGSLHLMSGLLLKMSDSSIDQNFTPARLVIKNISAVKLTFSCMKKIWKPSETSSKYIFISFLHFKAFNTLCLACIQAVQKSTLRPLGRCIHYLYRGICICSLIWDVLHSQNQSQLLIVSSKWDQGLYSKQKMQRKVVQFVGIFKNVSVVFECFCLFLYFCIIWLYGKKKKN